MTCQHLSDNKIIEGFRRGDSDIIQEYFYGYCRIGYFIYDQNMPEVMDERAVIYGDISAMDVTLSMPSPCMFDDKESVQT